jgi:hypothetical protein
MLDDIDVLFVEEAVWVAARRTGNQPTTSGVRPLSSTNQINKIATWASGDNAGWSISCPFFSDETRRSSRKRSENLVRHREYGGGWSNAR